MADTRSAKQNLAAAAAAIAVILVAGYFILRQTALKPPRNPAGGSVYVYDLATGALSAGAPGPDVIRASVFACSSCDDQADRFTAYVQMTKQEAIAEMQKPEPEAAVIEAGQLIAAPAKEPDWKMLSSLEGQALVESVYKKCEAPKACLP